MTVVGGVQQVTAGKYGSALRFPTSSGNMVYIPADKWQAVSGTVRSLEHLLII
jgi:hypothetical protein